MINNVKFVTILENRIECSTLLSFNIARENGPFIDCKNYDCPFKKYDFLFVRLGLLY